MYQNLELKNIVSFSTSLFSFDFNYELFECHKAKLSFAINHLLEYFAQKHQNTEPPHGKISLYETNIEFHIYKIGVETLL